MPQATINLRSETVRLPHATYNELCRLAAATSRTLSATIHDLAVEGLTARGAARGELYIPAQFSFSLTRGGLAPAFQLSHPALGDVTLTLGEARMIATWLQGPKASGPGDLDSIASQHGTRLRVQRRGFIVWVNLGGPEKLSFSAATARSVGDAMLMVISAAVP